MFNTIVVGTDGSTTANEAVDKAAGLAKLCGASLHVVTAFKPFAELMHPEFSALPVDVQAMVNPHEDALTIVNDVAASQKRNGVDVHAHAKPGSAADVLITTAEELRADLIVVGNRGMAGARRVLGSVPNSVSHHAPCTVMIVSTC